jgi:Divergent InlB B-repeat domain
MNLRLTREGRVRAREFMDTFRWPLVIVILFLGALCAAPSHAAGVLKVMKQGLGTGTITSAPAGMIDCGADCDESFALTAPITLTAVAPGGSTFVGWQGDCAAFGAAVNCNLTMSGNRSVRAEFRLNPDIAPLADFTPEGIQSYLTANPAVTSAARFVRALPADFKQGWILMTRSESLQTGTAKFPRILMPNSNAQFTFTVGLAEHASYPGAHHDAIEYMQWDAVEKNFRFHEIVLNPIAAMGEFPARARGVSRDEPRCTRCHSTRNIPNPSTTDLGTTGNPPGLVKSKNKPNWDTYDSWGGAMPFNRDRIYQGSVEAAAFRSLLNPWTWRANDSARQVIEQLELQPPGVPAGDVITRTNGGTNDGHVNFAFDSGLVLTEPAPAGTGVSINYTFNGLPGVGAGTTVQRADNKVILHAVGTPLNDEGRAVQFFDLLGGGDGNFNQTRIGNELASHRFATGSFPLDTRPVALAINKGCLNVNSAGNNVTPSTGSLTFDQAFFSSRHGGLTLNDIVANTQARRQSMPRRKADIEKLNLDRDGDVYLIAPSSPEVDLIEQYGLATSFGTATSLERLRQEVFRRPIDAGVADSVIGGIYVDREIYGSTTDRIALYRYLLEPLGVSVDKWSMGVRGRSRTFTFADVFGTYTGPITNELQASLTADPFPGLASPFDCAGLVPAVNTALAALPAYQDVPRYTDVQRIFNKSCVECHGRLGYPPFAKYFPASYLDFSEEESPASGDRLLRSHGYAASFVTTDPATSYLYQRINEPSEACPFGVMPCGGPPLVKADIETIRRWIVGGKPNTAGDPHITTMNGVPYDFQSAGEFTLLRGEDLEVQARQSPIQTDTPLAPDGQSGLSSCPSLNTAAAVRVGKHRITYQPNLGGQPDPNGLQLRVDGKLIEKLGARGVLLADGGRILPTTAGGIQIEFPGGTDVVITPGWWAYYQVWFLNIDVRHSRANQGVMGTISPNQWLPAMGDDTFLGPRPAALSSRYKQIYSKFADSWRVNKQTTLFDYASGTSTATYTLRGWPEFEPKSCKLPPGWDPKIEPPKPLPAEEAKKLCSAVVDTQRRANCEQDVMLTGDAVFAQTYVATERIQRNAIPGAPLLTLPQKSQVDLGDSVSFAWQPVKDKDNGKLTYQHCVWPAGDKQTFNHCKELGPQAESTVVAGLKSGQAYFWKVVVDDGQGGTVESETRRFATK